ncbi:hypothetical protein BGX38DRAFT_336691 [Terfezia claveryi]|nr:hypothetical protein BGX38DRAFT_336691 [Terfezia claveryi]
MSPNIGCTSYNRNSPTAIQSSLVILFVFSSNCFLSSSNVLSSSSESVDSHTLSTSSSSPPSSPPSSKLSAISSNSLLMPLKEHTSSKNVGVILTFDTAGVLAGVSNCAGSSVLCVGRAFCRLGIWIWRPPFPLPLLFPDCGIIITSYCCYAPFLPLALESLSPRAKGCHV